MVHQARKTPKSETWALKPERKVLQDEHLQSTIEERERTAAATSTCSKWADAEDVDEEPDGAVVVVDDQRRVFEVHQRRVDKVWPSTPRACGRLAL